MLLEPEIDLGLAIVNNCWTVAPCRVRYVCVLCWVEIILDHGGAQKKSVLPGLPTIAGLALGLGHFTKHDTSSARVMLSDAPDVIQRLRRDNGRRKGTYEYGPTETRS